MPHASKRKSNLPESRYLNRELSWLAFNFRVLEEAENTRNPLLERLNFLAISASNLDEFYMVRVAGLKDYIWQGVEHQSIDGLLPKDELAIVHEATLALVARQNRVWDDIRENLSEEQVMMADVNQLTHKDVSWLSEHFMDNIFPALTPIAIDPAHPFPFLPNLGIALIFKLQALGKKQEQIAIVSLPSSLPRFVRLPGKRHRFLFIEDVISFFFDALFPAHQVIDKALFRVIRDSELDVEDEAEDFMQHFEQAIKQRRRGRVIRVRFATPASSYLVQFVREHLRVDAVDTLELDGMVGMRSLKEIYEQCPSTLKYPPFKARFPERINDYDGDCFAAIAAKDIVVHHPFETFDVVVQFLKQAANDPDVVSIKQTLYRTSKDSPIVKALIEAAEAGKAVTALIELKARFDEEANLRWARDLERVGVQVVYGFVSLKTHAKVCLVTRREGKKLKSYAHFGTGNYHPSTARIYTDLSFFTCDVALCRDAAYLFNFVTGYAPPRAYKKLIVAPNHMRNGLLALIENEIAHAKDGKPAAIWAKMNALLDPRVIDALYEASQAGVQIDLVVRGICCLKPGVAGLSENIRVKSIVGRFLEHARIACFANGHTLPSPHAKIFISSADWMPRNLDRRVEIMIPIENPTVHQQIMEQIMLANLKDEASSWMMHADGSYTRVHAETGALSAHSYFMKNPSLSGRGTALHKNMSTSKKGKFKRVK
jgi:polyphosphate kinase